LIKEEKSFKLQIVKKKESTEEDNRMREGSGLRTELIKGVEKKKNKIGKTKKVRNYEL